MAGDKQDSNLVGLYVAREESNGVLGANPIFREREPNSFDDLGGEYTSIARRPFSPSRQRKKGGTVDLDADGGWNEDFTQRGMNDTMEAFFFAAIRRKPTTLATMADAGTDDFTVADSTGFVANSLILASNFRRNNGLHVVNAAVDATHVSTTSALVTEAATNGRVEVVGHRFAAGDISISVVGGVAVFASTSLDMRTFGLIPGEWVFIGGDQAGTHFDGIPGFYARIAEVNEDDIRFDKTTRAIGAGSNGAAKTIDLYFGYLVKNEDDPELIVKHTHTVERTLGRDDNGIMSESLAGFVLNEMTWNSPLADKVNIDIAGIAMSHTPRDGAEGPLHKDAGASVVKAEGDDLFNTSSNVFRLRLSVLDEDTLNPTPIFARVTEWSASINNNVTVNKAQGTLGGFDTTAGQFDFDGEFTAYFNSNAGTLSIRDNLDVTFDAIYSKQNAAVILDVPLIATGGGRLNIEMDAPIMLPLTIMGAQSPFGHTALLNWLPYVPNVGIANGR